MIIGNIDTDREVLIVAEIGNNHEGSYALAEELIGRAAEAGANAVKFQTFIPELFVSKEDADRLERLRKFQLSFNQFEALAKRANKHGVLFFSTPLDLESARFLNSIQSVFKIASGDNTFYPLIDAVAGFSKPMIVSTGLADISLVESIHDRIMSVWAKDRVAPGLALLHCVASYPVPPEQANLGAIATLRTRFPKAVIGYSDHTQGVEAAVYSVAAGARIIEKHFTMNKNYSDFRDHQLSADVSDFRYLVDRIRMVEVMLGTGTKRTEPCEDALMILARRSIAAARDLPSGVGLTLNDLTWVRPGSGILAGDECCVIGCKLIRPMKQGELFDLANLETEIKNER